MDGGAWQAAVRGVAKSWTRLSDFTFTFHFHALEKEMATHSSVLAWRIPGTGKPGGLPSMGLHRVGHNWSDLAAAAAARKVYYTYSYFYSLYYFFFLLIIPRTFFYHFLFVWRIFFSYFLKISLLVTNFYTFLQLRLLISSSFLKDIFTGYRILDWQFSFSIWKIFCHFLLAFMISNDKSTVILIVFPHR